MQSRSPVQARIRWRLTSDSPSGGTSTLDVVEVLLARENGFCFGVKKAVELTEAAAETGKPVYNLGQVVHNPKISERLGALGGKVIKDPADREEGDVVKRAHGVPPVMGG